MTSTRQLELNNGAAVGHMRLQILINTCAGWSFRRHILNFCQYSTRDTVTIIKIREQSRLHPTLAVAECLEERMSKRTTTLRLRSWVVERRYNAMDKLSEYSIAVITIPYYLLYERNTKLPIFAIAHAQDDMEASQRLEKWLGTKHKEAQYVQGAVTFASAISSMSFWDLNSRHWSGPACWYSSIVLSIVAVLSGAQQVILLDSFLLTESLAAREHLCRRSEGPNWIAVFAWQTPLMFLSYSLIFYIAGLTSYVASPVALNVQWDGDAKALVFYLITSACAFVIFAGASRQVHKTISKVEGNL